MLKIIKNLNFKTKSAKWFQRPYLENKPDYLIIQS